MNTHTHGGETAAGRTDNVGGRPRSLWKSPAAVTALVLLIPLLGNHFVDGWNWQFRGFVLAGALVFGTAVTYQLVTRHVDRIAYRAAVGVALASGFILVWGNFVQAADDINPAAVRYFLVPVVGLIAAAAARFRPNGMARALFATALAQALVLASNLIFRDPHVTSWTPAVLRGFGTNALLVAVFFGSALVVRNAARGKSGGTFIVPWK